VSPRTRKPAERLVFLCPKTEFGGDGERRPAAVDGGRKNEGIGEQWKFHGARPVGARGESRVSGPPQWGQVSRDSGWVVFPTSLFGLVVMAERICLAS
jgi:hypothetical protein